MSDTPVQEPRGRGSSSGSRHTAPSLPLQPTSDPSAPRRVCFYKSGDYKFSGHRMVINARTFKTFDALLDALAKKVPLPFGVRTITTPRGINLVKALDDLRDGGSYVCSDNKRVKPLNLDEVNRRQVPWNATRPLGAGRRGRQGPKLGPFGGKSEVAAVGGGRQARITERGAVRTPKRLVVVRNRDPTVKRTIVLQRRIAPTFDALLDYLSQILQFSVLKLFSTDGRRIDGLAALILCSGVVVAAGSEPFRLGTYSFHAASQMAQVMYVETMEPSTLQPATQNHKSLSSGRASRNFSLSSERYIVDQIKKSSSGTPEGRQGHHSGSPETDPRGDAPPEARGAGRVDRERRACIVPRDDDIEKSFCVNQDGSMTVEMKVRLTIKEEEMLHWTTTLSRSSLGKGTACASVSEPGNGSPESNAAAAQDSPGASEEEGREEDRPAGPGKGVDFCTQPADEGHTAGNAKSGSKRTATPGPRRVTKKASVESVKTTTGSGVRQSTLGRYSYTERRADGEKTEGYCVVKKSSSSSRRNNEPVPKTRMTASAGASDQGCRSSARSSAVGEVLGIQSNGMEVTETVMHIYESQGCYDNYSANEEYSAGSGTVNRSTSAPESKPSTESGQRSSGNDCDIDLSWQPPTTHSQQRQKEDMLSLSSEPVTPSNGIAATNSQIREKAKKDKTPKSETKKKANKAARNEEGLTSTSSSDKKQKPSIVSPPKNGKDSSTDKLSSYASLEKKTLSSSGSAKSGQKSRGAKRPQINKARKDENSPRKEPALLNVRRTPPKRLNVGKPAAKDNGHNVNTPTGRPQMKKNLSDILQPNKSLLPGKKTISRPKSMTENRVPSPKTSLKFPESSLPSLTPSPSEVHQYVENWLDKVSPDPVPYTEEATEDKSQPPTKVVFKIGDDSESEEKAGSPTPPDEAHLSPGDAIRRSASLADCCGAAALPHGEQHGRGLCVSMPSVRVDLAQQQQQQEEEEEDGPRPHPTGGGSAASSTRNLLHPKANTGHVLHDLYSSIHCIRSACEADATPGLEKSSSLPNISTQVASVFGSSCKAFMSFLSVVTLRDNLTTPALGDGVEHEDLLTLESLQKISAAEDEEELRASLTDLQSRASSRLRERWGDFQTLRERLESEPLSPKFSDTEFALDVASEAGDAFENIEELMDELNMPQDLRAEISSTIQQAKSFYPVEESTLVENERDPSDSEDDLEQFVECNNERKPVPETTSTPGDIDSPKGGNDIGEIDESEIKQPMYSESEHEHDKEPEVSHTDTDETLTDRENDEEDEELVKGRKDEEGTEEEMTVEEEDGEKQEEAQKVSMDEDVQEAREDDSVEETDEREGNDETEEEEDEGVDVKRLGDETEEDAGEVSDEENIMAEVKEEEEDDAGESIGETGEGEEVGVIKDADAEEEADQSMGETDGEGVGNIDQSEEEDADTDDFSEDVEEEAEEDFEDVEKDNSQEMTAVIEEKDEEEDVGYIINEIQEEEEEEEEETEALTEKPVEGEVIEEKDEEEEKTEVATEEIDMDEEEREQELVEEGEDVEVKNIKEHVVTDKEDEEDKNDRNMKEEEKWDEGEESEKELQETVDSLEDQSVGEQEVEVDVEAAEMSEREDDEERDSKDVNEGSNETHQQESKDAVEGEKASESSCDEAGGDAKAVDPDSPTQYSPECQCEDDKGNGTDSVNGFQTDEGGEPCEEGSGTPQHPVEISQELLDFVNSALQSSSLVFAYDARGNVRLETDRVTQDKRPATLCNRVAQNKQPAIPKSRKDITYGSKRLPSPSTSGLSDYRPETSESGGYKTQESVDVVTDSGEEAPARRQKPVALVGRTNAEEQADPEPPSTSDAVSPDSRQKSGGSFSCHDSATEASKEDLSYFSAASSQKADTEPATEAPATTPEEDSADGVLIDRGRWLLKENHLIRKSPPVSLGMYGQLDSTSGDTGPDDASQESPSRRKFQNDPLAAVSSSDLEEMAKPPTPKCTYYNMPHGSDSDPFSDEGSVKSGKRDTSSLRGRGFRVSPTIDTSKTWTNKNSSTSSFASVEFKTPDRKVHPEGESVAVTRWTPGGGRSVLQAQDSRDTLHVRCSQYCPIL
ncbi:rp1 [Pungitius sinensis]